MLESAREFVSSHNDVSKLVREARSFSVKLPVVGKVSVPPPKHLAFYGVLGVLGATELIPWPIAIGIGVGHALTVRRPAEDTAPSTPTATSASSKPAAKKAPAKPAAAKPAAAKAPARKAPAKKQAPKS